jgi:predicted DNA-binding antitoxin AbrB/MazE fold protein
MKIQNVKAVYKAGVFKPLHKINLPEGAEVKLTIEVQPALSEETSALLKNPPPLSKFYGILKDVKEDSVTLQHKATTEYWPE